jgi:SpoVK/Ycf46/Vps4 family AAA+-type ATPase
MVLSDAIESKFAQIEKEYAARERLQNVGLPYLQRILLYGPPGCGKSLGAERLAKNLGLPLLKVQLSQLIDSYLGNTAKNIKTVFEIANKNPSVLFLDECDALMWSRSSDSGENVREMKRTVNTLLQALDEFESQDAMIVAATNLESSLDFAIWRRFDETIFMPKPNAAEIEKMLSKLLDKNHGWEAWLPKLNGYSHAEIVKVCQKARKLAFFDNCAVSQKHLANAIAVIEIKGQ